MLLKEARAGRKVLIVIDEAQNRKLRRLKPFDCYLILKLVLRSSFKLCYQVRRNSEKRSLTLISGSWHSGLPLFAGWSP